MFRRRQPPSTPPSTGRCNFLVEICDEAQCWQDVYRFEDLPLPLRQRVQSPAGRDGIEWTSPDGCHWTVQPAYV